jgi:hypothetical protein
VAEPKPYTDIGGGGPNPPHGEDFFDRIVNVHWPQRGVAAGGVFSFAGYVNLTIVTPPTESALGQSTPHFTWLGGTSSGGTSSDGIKWPSNSSEAGLALLCCVRGKVGEQFIAVAAGSVLDGPYDFGPGYSINWGEVPAGGVSYDDGLTWNDAGIPKQKHILKPPNPATGQGADSASGSCNAVAYHPGTQTFYVGGSVIFSVGADTYWEDRMYTAEGGLVYSERRELSTPFKGYKWPTVPIDLTGKVLPENRLRVADTTLTTEAGSDVLFVVSFGPGQPAEYITTKKVKSYVAVNADGIGAIWGGTDTEPPRDIAPPMAVVNSICGGIGQIVAVGWQDEDQRIGPVTFISNDDGANWFPILSSLTNTAPGPDDKDSGSNSGSCSF